jgi:GNAT superfamily N-acetyltransferase
MVSVRRPTQADVPALHALVHEFLIHHDDPREHFTLEACQRDLIGEGRAMETFVAELDGVLVGYAALTPAYELPYAVRGYYLSDIFVTERARRKGVAKALIAAAREFTQAKGGFYLWWVSRAWNKEAQAFYDGFAQKQMDVKSYAYIFDHPPPER